MHKKNSILQQIHHYLACSLKDQLSKAQTSAQLCLLALLFAVCASCVIIVFRLLLQWSDSFTGLQEMDFTGIVSHWRALIPLLGAFLIYLVATASSKRYRRMGIAYVLHRVKLHYGKIPLATAPGQFFQALLALGTNFSVGREGPAIHLGAVTASVLAEKFNLPDNSVRIMAASGIAAGIAATFNAPLAAVIFVFEVILREYKVHYFFPIMLSAICGAISSQIVFGNVHELDNIQVINIPLEHYPVLAIGGLFLGAIAALFNHSLLKVTAWGQDSPLYQRLLLAGAVTSLIGFFLPQALGTGELAIAISISENPGLVMLCAILAAKMIATIAALGLGIPGGIIGPLYGIGALVGAILAHISAMYFPSLVPFIGLYTIIGMTAMMGVCLTAPLAALVALLELTHDANIIMPAMFVTIPAFLLAYQGLNTRSVFFKQLEIMGLSYKIPPVNQGLQKIGVRTLMDRRYVLVKEDKALQLEVLKRAEGRPVLFKTADNKIAHVKLDMSLGVEPSLSHIHIEGLPDSASLNRVYETLAPKREGAVFIYEGSKDNIVGVISWNMLFNEIRAGQV